MPAAEGVVFEYLLRSDLARETSHDPLAEARRTTLEEAILQAITPRGG